MKRLVYFVYFGLSLTLFAFLVAHRITINSGITLNQWEAVRELFTEKGNASAVSAIKFAGSGQSGQLTGGEEIEKFFDDFRATWARPMNGQLPPQEHFSRSQTISILLNQKWIKCEIHYGSHSCRLESKTQELGWVAKIYVKK